MLLQVPGNIRRAEHFVAFLRRFVAYLKQRMEVQQVESETPTSFLGQLQGQVAIDGECQSVIDNVVIGSHRCHLGSQKTTRHF